MPPEQLQLNLRNSVVANRAMASVLLLYYHLLREGGITNDQTVYINAEDFDPFKYLSVKVSDDLSDVDELLLREGAAIHLLCDLNDIVGEYETDYLKQPYTKRILAALGAVPDVSVPEALDIARMVASGESSLHYPDLSLRLAAVYQRYVAGRFRELVRGDA